MVLKCRMWRHERLVEQVQLRAAKIFLHSSSSIQSPLQITFLSNAAMAMSVYMQMHSNPTPSVIDFCPFYATPVPSCLMILYHPCGQ